MKIIYILLVTFGGQTVEEKSFPFTVDGYGACVAKVREYDSASTKRHPIRAACSIRQEPVETLN